MTDTVYVDGSTIFTADSANDFNRLHYTIFGDPADDKAAVTGLGSAKPLVLASGNLQSNVTGDGTTYTLLWANEIADRGANFASPTFTAPITGIYRFNLILDLAGITTHTRLDVVLVTTARSYRLFYTDALNNHIDSGSGGFLSLSLGALADMSATDTASITVQVAGGANTKVVDLDAVSTPAGNYLSIELVA